MRRKFDYYECVPEWIGVKTNAKDFRWGFGKCDIPVAEEDFNRCKIKVVLEVKNDASVFEGVDTDAFSNHFRHFRASPQSGALLFDQKVARVFSLRYMLKVNEDTVHIAVGMTYYRFVKAKIMYIHSIAYILFDIVSMLLLHKGATTLYCSSVRLKNGKTLAFMAPPNTGKSLTVLKLRRDLEAEIIAEDMAVTDGKRIWGAPHTGLYRNYHDVSLLKHQSERSTCISDRVDIVAIFQKGASYRGCVPEDCLDKLILLNRYSLGYYYSPCVRVLDYYNDAFSTRTAQETERRILGKLQSGAQVFLIEDLDPMKFSEHIASLLDDLEHENEV